MKTTREQAERMVAELLAEGATWAGVEVVEVDPDLDLDGIEEIGAEIAGQDLRRTDRLA